MDIYKRIEEHEVAYDLGELRMEKEAKLKRIAAIDAILKEAETGIKEIEIAPDGE